MVHLLGTPLTLGPHLTMASTRVLRPAAHLMDLQLTLVSMVTHLFTLMAIRLVHHKQLTDMGLLHNMVPILK